VARGEGVPVIYLLDGTNAFEFAVVAGLRAKQLMAGCVPRVAAAHTCTRTASLEVRAGRVARVPTVPAPAVVTGQQLPSSHAEAAGHEHEHDPCR
jgi:hypothetical protein